MKVLKTLLLIIALISLTGCGVATSKIVSVSNHRQMPKNGHYKKIAIHIPGDLSTQKTASEKMIKKLKYLSDTEAISTLDLFFPKKQYSRNQVRRILKKNNVDALIIANLTGSGSYRSSVSIPTLNSGTANTSGMVGGQNVNLSTSYVYTGATVVPITIYTVQYDIDMYDVKTGKIIWNAELTTRGDTTNAMISSAVSKTVRELGKSGMISYKRKSRRRF